MYLNDYMVNAFSVFYGLGIALFVLACCYLVFALVAAIVRSVNDTVPCAPY